MGVEPRQPKNHSNPKSGIWPKAVSGREASSGQLQPVKVSNAYSPGDTRAKLAERVS